MHTGHYLGSLLIVASMLAASAYPVQLCAQTAMSPAATASDEAAIRGVLAGYNAALNGGKTAAVLPLYTDDGVFMPPYSQSAVGKDAVRKAYDAVFDELKFNVKFDIAELVVISPLWAYVRTNSAGTTGHHSTGKTTAEANQELFLFKKGDDGHWRIARYSFSPTNPPAK
ncbi:MAG TPA: SgcJ/EcaC family oxidoreductase [Pirellulales bacterium]|jgi:uncharacterized protein (TIGR02246 family)